MSGKGVFNLEYLGITEDQIKTVDASESEVVSRQIMSRVRDIVATIRPDGIQFNATSVRSMGDVVFIQMLIDRNKHLLYVRPAEEYDKDSFRWCSFSDGKKVGRKITGRNFGSRIYKAMGWCKGFSYRVGGGPAKQLDADDEFLLVFELDEYDETLMTTKALLAAGVEDEDLGEKAEQIRLEISAMEKERAEVRATAAAGKKKKAKGYTRFQKTFDDASFGVKKKEHVDRIAVPPVEQLELVSLFEGDEERDK